MIGSKRMRTGRRRGAVAVIVALCLVPLIGVMAFAVDGGLLLAARRRAQSAADASAHAAAVQLYTNALSDLTGLDVSGKARAAALLTGSTNGYNNDGSTNKVTINMPPQSGYFAGKPFYAEVIIVIQQPRMFSGVFGSGTWPVQGRGVARGSNGAATPYTNASLVVLDPSASGALNVTGAGVINAESAVQVNSSNSAAATGSGSASVTASAIQITGNYSTSGSARFTTTSAAAVQTAAPVMADPLGSLAPPSTSTLTARSFQSTYGSATISPGVYSGGITIGGGMTVTMSPGIYYMKAGSFNLTNGATVTGTGVTIYIDNGGGSFNVVGGANLNLTPPTSGTYAGLTYYQDRSNSQALNISNGGTVTIAGTIYAPAASAGITGGSNNKYGSQLIVKTVSVTNGATLKLTTNTDAKSGYVASQAGTASITVVE